jgi:hypothetical protein
MSNIDHGRRHLFGQIVGQSVRACTWGFPEGSDWRLSMLCHEAQMERFVHRENIKLYRRLLAETTDEQRREMLLKLLTDEEAKYQQAPEKSTVEAHAFDLAQNDGAAVRAK